MGFVVPAYVKMQPVLGPKNKYPSASSAVTNDSWTVTAGVIKRGHHPGWSNKGEVTLEVLLCLRQPSCPGVLMSLNQS